MASCAELGLQQEDPVLNTPAWRFDDAAAYDALRSRASILVGEFTRVGDVTTATQIRTKVMSVDAFDRTALHDVAAWLEEIADLDADSR